MLADRFAQRNRVHRGPVRFEVLRACRLRALQCRTGRAPDVVVTAQHECLERGPRLGLVVRNSTRESGGEDRCADQRRHAALAQKDFPSHIAPYNQGLPLSCEKSGRRPGDSHGGPGTLDIAFDKGDLNRQELATAARVLSSIVQSRVD